MAATLPTVPSPLAPVVSEHTRPRHRTINGQREQLRESFSRSEPVEMFFGRVVEAVMFLPPPPAHTVSCLRPLAAAVDFSAFLQTEISESVLGKILWSTGLKVLKESSSDEKKNPKQLCDLVTLL